MEFRLKKGDEIIEGVCAGRYYPKRFKLVQFQDELSRELLWLKKHKDDTLIEKWGKTLAGVIRETGKQFDILTVPQCSKRSGKSLEICRKQNQVVKKQKEFITRNKKKKG
jgi:hypothetical protein